MTDSTPDPVTTEPSPPKEKAFVRFSLSQRIEHAIFLVSFTILGLTGLPQKYAASPISQSFLVLFGGIERTRQIHHIAAVILMVVSIYHINAVLYQIIVLRTPFSMLPVFGDFKHLFQDLAYYFDLRKTKAYYQRYNYAEKAEYLAVVWGTVIMAITGFMMWNPITTARLLPGEFIPAAKTAHGAEAVLAVLAIILWHFYHVHLRHFNRSMFTGKLTQAEMQHEHPGELARLESEHPHPKVSHAILRRRQQVYYPLAVVLTCVLSFGLVRFVTAEKTSITTIPKGETAAIFVPFTPTPKPTVTPTSLVAANNTWQGKYQALFQNRCGACHGISKISGLNLTDYQNAMKGGNTGPAIIPRDPDNSQLVKVQSQGGHPGQLTRDELSQVIEWIKAGVP